MEDIKIEDVVLAVRGKVLSGNSENIYISSVATDSRENMLNGLFVAIKGENTNGHKYIWDAIQNGAIAILVSEEQQDYIEDIVYIKVEDTIKSLQDLASWYRLKFNIPVVAITGSVGKTTTKDMIASVLETEYKVLKTEGNFNSEIGAPMTVLKLNASHEVAVIEMGMDHLRQISKISEIVKPDTAVITNIGVAHIEYLKTRENILKAKCEVFENLTRDGVAILNADDDMLVKVNNDFKKVWYGTSDSADIKVDNIVVDYKEAIVKAELYLQEDKYDLVIPGLSNHLVYSAMSAIAVGLRYNIAIDKILKGIENYTHTKMRMDIYKLQDNIIVIDDTYNANPDSMKSLINTVKKANTKNKILIIGDMFELGKNSISLHIDVLQYALDNGITKVLITGDNMKQACDILKDTNIVYYETKEILIGDIKHIVVEDSIIA
ncbi:MAG: UDP-N-acetylmuramoyl-tripeptide--D-alanyl-D-alanine ligase, partial [Clostridia bacterium]|nr:UDP-N-acetylmuramoyl-tripeptide--D-alanyl-D-alanine ligase [Clostridia bacterium]